MIIPYQDYGSHIPELSSDKIVRSGGLTDIIFTSIASMAKMKLLAQIREKMKQANYAPATIEVYITLCAKISETTLPHKLV